MMNTIYTMHVYLNTVASKTCHRRRCWRGLVTSNEAGGTIGSEDIGSEDIGSEDKAYVSSGQQIVGYNKKGKEFSKYQTNLSESINRVFPYDSKLWTGISNHYHHSLFLIAACFQQPILSTTNFKTVKIKTSSCARTVSTICFFSNPNSMVMAFLRLYWAARTSIFASWGVMSLWQRNPSQAPSRHLQNTQSVRIYRIYSTAAARSHSVYFNIHLHQAIMRQEFENTLEDYT
jgi:hypothetical protein